MTAAIPTSVPAELVAGDTWAFTRTYGDYPASSWTATIYFQNKDGNFAIIATASGSDFAFNLDAASSKKSPGRYKWRVRVTNGTTLTTVEEGWTEVIPDPAATGNRDLRSDARQLLDAVNATLQGRATSDQLSTTINGRSISRIPLTELRDWQAQLRQQVNTEEGAAGAGSNRDIKVRFRRG